MRSVWLAPDGPLPTSSTRPGDRARAGIALDLTLQALETFRKHGDRFMTGWTVYTAGMSELVMGDPAAARPRLVDALAIFRETQDVSGVYRGPGRHRGGRVHAWRPGTRGHDRGRGRDA